MVSLLDAQLDAVIQAAKDLEPEKRSVYLVRITSILALRGVTDEDVADATRLALVGLVQRTDSAA